MIAGTLEIQMLANLARLQSDMTQAKGMIGGAMKSIESSVAMATRALGALGVGLGVGYFARFLKGIVDTQDELSKLSQKLNIPVEQLAGLRHAADLAGVSGEALTKGFKTLSSQMFDSSMGLLESKRNFGLLGIEVQKTDGTLRTTQAVMLQVADKFAGMQDGAAKSALAVKLFGKAGLDMIPLLNEGSAAIAGMIAEGQRLNPVTTESAKQAEIFNDNMTRVSGTMKGAFIAAMNGVMPAISDISKAMAEAAKESGFWAAALVGLGGVISKIFQLPEFQKANKEFAELTQQLLFLENQRDKVKAEESEGWITRFFAGRLPLPEIEKRIASITARLTDLQKVRDEFEKSSTPPPEKVLRTLEIPDDAALKKAVAEAKKLQDAYDGLLESMRAKLALDKDSTELEKLQQSLTEKKWEKLGPAQREQLIALAKELDLKNQLEKQIENETKALMDYAQWLEKVQGELAASIGKEDEARNNAIQSASKQIEQMELETSLISKTNVERETAIFLRQAEIDKIDSATIARMKEAIAAKHVAKEANDAQVSMWRSVEDAGHQAFLSIFDTSKSVLERIRSMLKTHLIDILYQMTVKKWIFNIIGSVSGAGVAQQALGSVGGGLSALGSAGSASGAFSGIASIGSAITGFGADYALGASMGAAMLEGGGAITIGSQIGASLAGAVGSTVAAAIPYIGIALLAYSLLKSNKVSAISTGDLGRNFSASGQQTGADWTTYGVGGAAPTVTSLQQRYALSVAALGGTAAASNFYFGSNTGEGGKNPMFRLAGGAGGRSFDTGAEIKMDDAALELAASRAILTALQGSQLPEYLAKYLNTLTAESMDQTAINNAMQFAAGLRTLREQLTLQPLGIATLRISEMNAALGTSITTLDEWKTQFLAAIDAGTGPEAVARWQALGQALQQVGQVAQDVIAAAANQRTIMRSIGDEITGFANAARDAAANVAQARDDIRTEYFTALDDLNNLMRQSADAARNMGKSIDDYLLHTLLPSVSNPAAQYQQAKRELSAVAALAKTGDVDAQGKLIQIAERFRVSAQANAPDARAYARDAAFSANLLMDVRDTLAMAFPTRAGPLSAAGVPLTATQQTQLEILAAQQRVVALATAAAVTGTSLVRETSSTAATVRQLLESFNTAYGANTTAQANLTEALNLVAGLQITAVEPLDNLRNMLVSLAGASATVDSFLASLTPETVTAFLASMTPAQVIAFLTSLNPTQIDLFMTRFGYLLPADQVITFNSAIASMTAAASAFAAWVQSLIGAGVTPITQIPNEVVTTVLNDSEFIGSETFQISADAAAAAAADAAVRAAAAATDIISNVILDTTNLVIDQMGPSSASAYNTLTRTASGAYTAASPGGATLLQLPGQRIEDSMITGLSGSQYRVADVVSALQAASQSEAGIRDAMATMRTEGLSLSSANALMGLPEGTAEAMAQQLGIPVFRAGTDFVPQTGPALLHYGERVTPAGSNRSDATNEALLEELKSVRLELVAVKKSVADTADATMKTKNELQQVVRGGLSLQTRAAGT